MSSRNASKVDRQPTPPRSSPLVAEESKHKLFDEQGVGSVMLDADWGTRSLRKSLRELHLNDIYHNFPVVTSRTAYSSLNNTTVSLPVATTSATTSSSVNQMETVFDDHEASDAPLFSPWQDDHENVNSTVGLKMPRRVTSSDEEGKRVLSQGVQVEESSCLSTTPTATPTSKPPPCQQNGLCRSKNTLDDGASPSREAVDASEETQEFAWQVRSPFRRSISSSDIEKYQRQFNGGVLDDSFGYLSNSDSEDDEGTQKELLEIHAQPSQDSAASVEAAPSTTAASSARQSPLLEISRRKVDTCASTMNDAIPKKPRRGEKKRRGHRRSNSDDPELLMESADISDVAPRMPTRTTSRPKSPPVVYERKPYVRFATNQNFVVEIPKVTEDMKPTLFYTKRDVKRFRMNEHRRQEAQIRAYVEYLNEKDNALDSSPSIYDS